VSRGGLLALCAFAAGHAAAFTFCDDRQARIAFQRVHEPWPARLAKKEFAELDRHFNSLLAQQAKGTFSDAAVDRAFLVFRGKVGEAPLHEEWSRLYPRSGAAHLAHAYHHIAHGAAERGQDLSAAPTPSQLEAMRASFRAALQELRVAERHVERPSLVAALRIRIAGLDRASDAGDARQLYAGALERFPETLAVRIQYIKASHPPGGGGDRQLATILEDARRLPAADARYVEYLVFEERGAIAEAAGDHARAIADYERSAPLCKGLDGTVDRLMKLLVRKGDHARVVAVATGILERIPRDGWTLWQRGRAHRALSQHPQALADLRRAAEIGQTSASEDLAWYYETGTGVARDLQRALELYRAAEAIDSPTAPAHVQRVSAMMAGGRR